MDSMQVKSNLNVCRVILLCLLIVALVVLASRYLPDGIDWRDTYRPASLALLSGRSPYTIDTFFNAPWVLIPLVPFALLPENIGRALLLLLGLSTFAFAAYRLGAKPLALTAFLASPPVVHCLLNSNVEWLPLLGFVVPPQLGLFLIVLKPQMGVGVGLFWLVEACRKGGLREVIRVFLPATLALLISFALFGFWPMRFMDTLTLAQPHNASLWPSSIPLGLALMVASFRKRDLRYAMAASPCLSPYVLFSSWVGALASVLQEPAEALAAVVGLWVLVVLRAFTGAL